MNIKFEGMMAALYEDVEFEAIVPAEAQNNG